MTRVFNFSAGPAALPESVLRAQPHLAWWTRVQGTQFIRTELAGRDGVILLDRAVAQARAGGLDVAGALPKPFATAALRALLLAAHETLRHDRDHRRRDE